jgi:ATP-binding cassette subfamily F protein 3
LLATFNAPHILVLDEPTNHLDVDSREALVMAINDYEGAVILISHDRHIVETCADRLWLVRNGTVKPYDGDLDSYTDLILGRKPQASKSEVFSVTSKGSRENPRSVQKIIQEIDSKILILRDKISVLDRALEDPAIYSEEPRKAADFAKLRARLAADLDRCETEWLEANE